MAAGDESSRKAAYVRAVTRGHGFMPWQDHRRVSPREQAFRGEVERRKSAMLGRRAPVRHPVLLTERELELARRNIRRAAWAGRWLEAQQAVVEGVRFMGTFGVVCWPVGGRPWLVSCGASTCLVEEPRPASGRRAFGFSGQPARWAGPVTARTDRELVAATVQPDRWPAPAPDVASYVLLSTGRYRTGVPVSRVSRRRIQVARFPLPAARRFELLAVQCSQGD